MNATEMHAAPPILILGAGGHARMLIDALQAAGERRAIGVLDCDAGRLGTLVAGMPVVGTDDSLDALSAAGSTHFAVGVGSPVSGDTSVRQSLFARARELGLQPLSIVHPQAIVSRTATLEAGAQILPGAIVNSGSRIGANTIVNSGAIVEHDCRIGAHVHIASGACLAGGVIVGDGAHIGALAAVRQTIRIGRAAVIGIGAVVIADVPDGVVVAGVPAQPLRSERSAP